MRPYERRQEILAMLRERSEVRVTELTEVFGVSEGTVRSDLDFLAAQDQITRIHGGAASANTHQIGNPAFAAR
ncbi:MAG: DeoR family transcriptional regulator, partial [Caldilineaceae bacterium]